MPPADNTRHLQEAAKRRHEEARARAERAITAARKSKAKVTLLGIAEAAGVSKSWLYTQADLRAAIDQLRHHGASGSIVAKKTSTESLGRRLETALVRNRELRQRVNELNDRLEAVYGELRRLRTFAEG